MGGPGRTPHVLVQAGVEPGTTRALQVPDAPGRYRVFARGGAMATLEVDADGESQVRTAPGKFKSGTTRHLEVTFGGLIKKELGLEWWS